MGSPDCVDSNSKTATGSRPSTKAVLVTRPRYLVYFLAFALLLFGVYLLSYSTGTGHKILGLRGREPHIAATSNQVSNIPRVDTAITGALTKPSKTDQTPADTPFSLTDVTVAANSFFYIKDPKTSYRVCDVLELSIEVRDGANVRKDHGGDVMWPYIHTAVLKASAPADELIDHGNGSFTARFMLTWAGQVQPAVRFVYSAEHAAALRNIRERVPNRFAYDGKFVANGISEVTPCHISKAIPYIGDMLWTGLSYSSENETCDFSDDGAGTTWYCLKPKTLPCESYVQHIGDSSRAGRYAVEVMTPQEENLSKSYSPRFLSNTGSEKIVDVLAKGQSNDVLNTCLNLPKCVPGLPPKRPRYSAGFYYEDLWQSKICRARTYNLPDTLQCLRGKRLYFYGDSTIRQWFEFLVSHLGPTMKEVNIRPGAARKVGPRYGEDRTNNITLFYRHHEFPIRNIWINVSDVKFTVNEVDSLPGGPDTVVAFTYWAHFAMTNLSYYESRLRNVQAAIERLQRRGSSGAASPVFIKSANTIDMLHVDLNDLYVYELDQVMRRLFTGMPGVTIIDAWDMTLSHRTGYVAHPLEIVIGEELKMFFNFLCGQGS